MRLSSAFSTPLITEKFYYGYDVSIERAERTATYERFSHAEAIFSEAESPRLGKTNWRQLPSTYFLRL